MRAALIAFALSMQASAWAAQPMTPADAFALGKSDGAAGGTDVAGQITGANATANVPGYTTTNVNSGYFAGGNGNPRTFGSARVLDCASTVYTQPEQQAECTAINQIAGDRSTRPITPIAPTDPTIATGRSIANNPEAVAGSFTSGYSACTTQTVTTPPVYETEICIHEKKIEPVSCQKTLTVTVQLQQCNAGDVLYTYSTYKGDTIRVICDPDPSKLRITGNFTGWCYNDYRGFGHLALVSVEATPQILQKGFIDFYRTDECKQYQTWTDEQGNSHLSYDENGYPICVLYGPGPVNGPIASMQPDVSPNNVLFGSYYRRGCMLELKPSSCDLADETCTFNLKFINQYNWDDSYYPDIISDLSASMRTPQFHGETDIWDTAACDILNSRTAP